MRGSGRVINISAMDVSGHTNEGFEHIPPEVARIAEGCGVDEAEGLRAIEDSGKCCVGVPYFRSDLWYCVRAAIIYTNNSNDNKTYIGVSSLEGGDALHKLGVVTDDDGLLRGLSRRCLGKHLQGVPSLSVGDDGKILTSGERSTGGTLTKRKLRAPVSLRLRMS